MSNQLKFDVTVNRVSELWDRIYGSLPGVAHRNKRLADEQDIAELPDRIFNKPLAWYGFDGVKNAKDTTLGSFISWIDTGLRALMNSVADVRGKVDAVAADVKTLVARPATGGGTTTAVVDQAALKALIDAAVKEAADKHFGNLGTYEFKKKVN